MPFALIFVGIVMTVAGVRGTEQQLFKLLKGDFTGQNSYLYWVLAIMVVGALGYIPSLRPVSRAFLALIIVVLFLHSGSGFFTKFQSAIASVSSNTSSVTNIASPNNPLTV